MYALALAFIISTAPTVTGDHPDGPFPTLRICEAELALAIIRGKINIPDYEVVGVCLPVKPDTTGSI